MTTATPGAKAPAGDRPALGDLPTAAAMASWVYLRPAFPDRFGSIADARTFAVTFLSY